MAKAAVATQSVGFEAIDRLEEKVKLLIGVIERLRGENARANEEIGRLRGEIDLRTPGADDPADIAARHRTRRTVLVAGVGIHE